MKSKSFFVKGTMCNGTTFPSTIIKEEMHHQKIKNTQLLSAFYTCHHGHRFYSPLFCVSLSCILY